MSLPEEIKVHMEIMTCNGCGAHALAFIDGWQVNPKRKKANGRTDFKQPVIVDSGGHRITGHKCSGAWTSVGKPLAVSFSLQTLESAIKAEEQRGIILEEQGYPLQKRGA